MAKKKEKGKLFFLLDRIFFYYPFSFLGTMVFVCGVVLLVIFINTANPVSLIISSGFLFITVAGAITGRIGASLLRGAVLEWDSSSVLSADAVAAHQYIHMESVRIIPLFNLHFSLYGRLRVGRHSSFYVREEHPLIKRKGKKIPFPVYFPFAGVFFANGRYIIRDIFGLTRSRWGEEEHRQLPVLPTTIPSLRIKEIVTNQGFEESVKKRSQDEERYFMREYVPGDRLRDINWKATARLDKLITKIAPFTQEQTKSVIVILRNIKETPQETFEALVHLNRLKSLLLSFLRQVKQSSKDFVFQVIAASDRFVLESEEDLERFSVNLASIEYVPFATGNRLDHNAGEIFVFTTQYDVQLLHFLALFPRAKATVVQTITAGRNETSKHALFRLFVPFRPSVLPGGFLFRTEKRPRPVRPADTKQLVYERDLLEIRLT